MRLAGERASQAQHHPDIAFLVELGTEGVFVVIAADLPAVADDLEGVGLALAARVLDARDIGPMRDVEPDVLPVVCETENLV